MSMKKYLPKVLSLALCLTMVICLVASAAYTAGAESGSAAAKDDEKAVSTSVENKPDGETAKEETVYAIADAEGNVSKVIVSGWIKNGDGSDKIEDKTNLKDLENVKGDEKFTIDSDNMCVWDAKGNDIYYKGTSEADLPVDVSVSYKLDGKKVSPDEIAGKSGKVTITFNYKNKQYEEVKINGKQEKIYVPFVMLTGLVLDNEKFSNVEVNNGKVINDGSRTIVAGFALPGMNSNLGIDSDEFEIPESVEITADASDFELATTITVATNDMFSDIDFSKLDNKVDELKEKLDELADATDKLVDGSSKLYDGISMLLEKSDTLISGVKTLASGAEKLASGVSELDSGADELSGGAEKLAGGAEALDKGAVKLNKGVSDLYTGVTQLDNGAGELKTGAAEMQSGLAQLAEGLGTLSENSYSLVSGAEQVFDTLLGAADSQIEAAGLNAEKLTIDNYAAVLDGITESLSEENVRKLAEDQARATVTAAVSSQEELIRAGVTAAVREQVLEGVLAQSGIGMDSEQYAAAVAAEQVPADTQAQINTAVEQQMASKAIADTIDTNTQEQINSLITQNMQSDEVAAQIQTAVDSAAAGAESIKSLKTQLDSFNTFYQGIINYTYGVDSASTGASQLADGSKELKGGTDTLKKGTGELKKGAKKLKKGTTTLKNGTKELRDGAVQLADGAKKLEGGTSKLLGGANQLSDGLTVLLGGTDQLIGGVKQLKSGALTLSDGLKQYREEGVDVIIKAVNGDAETLINRLKAVSKVSSDYRSFSGISDKMSGKVNFIYKTDSVETK